MGLGVNDAVYAMSVFGSDLIIGGKFTIAGFLPCNKVARYTINNIYYPLANGIDSGTVYALQVHNGIVYVGGDFTSIGSINVYYLASWDGTNWNSIGNGTNGAVLSLGEYGSNLIAGGKFTIAGSTPSNYISSWNGSSWSALGTGMSGGSPTQVEALSVWSNLLIAGGVFVTAGGTTVNNVASYGNIPGIPTLISPCSITTDTVAPLLDWSDVNFATSYGVQVSDNPNFTDTILRAANLPISQYQIGTGALLYNTTYFWRANATNGLGSSSWSLICYFTTPNPTGINKYPEVPKEFYLFQNYPNPFNPKTVIKYQLPKSGYISLDIFNIEGKEIEKLFYNRQETGTYEIEFNGSNIPSGVYFYKISLNDFTQTKKMILIK